MGPNQTDKLLHSEVSRKKKKKDDLQMGENSSKWCNWQGLTYTKYTNNLYNSTENNQMSNIDISE